MYTHIYICTYYMYLDTYRGAAVAQSLYNIDIYIYIYTYSLYIINTYIYIYIYTYYVYMYLCIYTHISIYPSDVYLGTSRGAAVAQTPYEIYTHV